MQGDRVESADREALAIDKQVVELATVALELGPALKTLPKTS